MFFLNMRLILKIQKILKIYFPNLITEYIFSNKARNFVMDFLLGQFKLSKDCNKNSEINNYILLYFSRMMKKTQNLLQMKSLKKKVKGKQGYYTSKIYQIECLAKTREMVVFNEMFQYV